MKAGDRFPAPAGLWGSDRDSRRHDATQYQASEQLQLIGEGLVFVDDEFRLQEIDSLGSRMARRPAAYFLERTPSALARGWRILT